ncbi:hypothetical protein ABQF17_12585 [Mycolicibacterium elephantis]|uniref:Secreted protein n=2 Tax=Mycolicibacterium elephantis TaxID=81858 RepID=A0A0M2ZD95_9MYCO|nr:hypothetical protein [Mycolicibacterium elephantis]KKW62290.1 hypothetical protein AAV95_23140 [Mycolicibacterium elephantis]OBA65633.1 hypothetical protein A5633_03805 [Mycolicibacterium elephantis]OBB26426.1 hypothetical protein A5762_09220 [Mycolicibacterium elephantis]OBE94221.1 hypothetical protein A5776_23850 [Mycolicibacterium elephantis]ORA63839.1 hypothetical protein BST23_17595 [Mycolicibacterium elephantis]
MNVRMLGAGAAMVGALGFTALGVGAGVASAEQAVPNSPGVTWKLDRPHWDDDWDDWRHEWRGARWDGPRYGGACAWVPPAVSMWVPPAAC